MAITAAAIGAAAAVEGQRAFGDAVQQLVVGEANYIRDGEPESVTVQIGQAVARAACRRYGAGNANPNPAQAERYERACRPYLDSIGQGSAVGLEQPFLGGQCDGFCYAFDVTSTTAGGGTATNRVRLIGPVTGFRVTETSPGQGIIEAFARSDGRLTPGCNPIGEPGWRPTGLGGQLPTLNSTVRVGFDAPEDCGNVPPEVRGPVAAPDPSPPPIRFSPRPGVDIVLDVDINNNGDIVFDIGTGPITFDPFGAIGDGGDGGGGGGDGDGPTGGDGPLGDVGSPGTPQEPGAGGEASGCAPDGFVLTGIKVDILEVPRSARQYAEGVYRGVCYAYLGVPGNLDHDPAGAMLRSGQFIFAERNNLTCFAVRANLGFNLRVTPYYRALE